MDHINFIDSWIALTNSTVDQKKMNIEEDTNDTKGSGHAA